MYRAIYATAAKQGVVGRIHDCIDIKCRYIRLDYFDHH
jgi:hypothetical protein